MGSGGIYKGVSFSIPALASSHLCKSLTDEISYMGIPNLLLQIQINRE